MTFRTRTAVGAMLVPLLMLAATPALAIDRPQEHVVIEQRTADRGADVAVDSRTVDVVDGRQVVDRTDTRLTDLSTDRRSDRITDQRRCDRADVRGDACCADRPVDRIPERCRDHRSDPVNVRHLIWRLIQAHQWEKLWQLLHRLGVI